MGIDDDPDIKLDGPQDPRLWAWPKNVLAVCLALSAAYAAFVLYSFELDELHVAIRLIYLICIPLLIGFVVVNQEWAMSGGLAVYLCYRTALFLFGYGGVSLVNIGFAVFIALLAVRSIIIAESLRQWRRHSPAEVFE